MPHDPYTPHGLLHQTLEHSPNPTQVMELLEPNDPGSFCFVYVNQAACDMVGMDLRAFIGKTWAETFPGAKHTDYARALMACIKTGKPQTWRTRQHDPVHGDAWWDGAANPLNATTLVMTYANVTERVNGLNRLKLANEDLDEFAYIVSHDLKTPLRNVDNLVGWIVDDLHEQVGEVPPDVARNVERLQGRVRRMERLLDELLMFSRVGRLESEPQQLSLRSVVDDAAALLALGDAFTIVYEGDDVTLRTPREPLRLVLSNLLDNALKHHDRASGRITVSAQPGLNHDHVRITVADDGPGIQTAYQDQIFKMFTTLAPEHRAKGTGLGLALVRKQVERVHGSVQVHSEGRGAAFTFTWPVDWHRLPAAP